jgi:hypothetical protein
MGVWTCNNFEGLYPVGTAAVVVADTEEHARWSAPRRDFYGLAEIATALYVKRKKVAKWYRKGRLPKPTDILATGPIWSAEAIDAFLHPPLKPLRDVLPRLSAERGGIRFAVPPPRDTD